MKAKTSKIACAHCGRSIENRGDLIVVSDFRHFPFAAYHNACYAGQLKQSLWTYGGTRPLNGRVGTFATAVTVVFALVFAFLVGWLYNATGLSMMLWPVGVLVLWAAVALAVRYWVYRAYETPLRG